MSEMKVTLIANAAQPVSEIGKLQASANETAKSFAQVTKAAVDGSKAATGSFQDLKARLAGARAELDKLTEGTPEFLEQAATVRALNTEFMTARQKIAELTAAEQGLATGTAILKETQQEAQAAAGSFQKLQEELSTATAEMNRLQVGSDEWKEQATNVARLTVGIDQAKQQIKELVAAETALQTGVIAEQATEAKAAVGSFRALNQELRDNVAALEEMAAGSDEFAAQKKKVDDLRAAVDKANTEMATSAKAIVGSYKRLEDELRENEAALKSLAIGSAQFEAQRKKVDQLKSSLEKAKGELTELSEAGRENSWTEVATSMGVATGAAAILYGALKKVADIQDQIIKGAADEVTELDTMARRLQIQAGLTDPQKAEQTKKIVEQSTIDGVKAEVGFAAATQLAGSGFQNAVDGGSLKIILDTIQASSFDGAPEELVSAFTEALNAYGLEKNNKNLEAIAVAAQSLFKQTDFQLVELADFAKNAAVFKSANIGLGQSMAAFTTLREVLPAAESGTGLRNFVNILQGGAATKESTEALGQLGLKPDQVDFVGENLNDVIATINTATAQMDEAAKNVALLKVFGRENVASAKLLLANADRVKELEKLQQNKEQFKIDLGVAAGGLQADRNRIANQLIIERMPIADEIAKIDINRRKFEEQLKVTTEKAAVSGVPGLGAAAAASSEVIKTADSVVGGGAVQDVNKGLFEVFRSLLGSKDESKQAADVARQQNGELIDLNRRQAAALEELLQQRPGAAPPGMPPLGWKPRVLAPAAAAAAAATSRSR